jgi:ABC-2 type transport system permease protein
LAGRNPGQAVKDAVASGKYQIGMVIPANATQQIRERVKGNMDSLFSGDSTRHAAHDTVFIMLYVDPATRNSLRSTLQGSIREYAARVESRIVLNELTREINTHLMIPVANLNLMKETVFYRENTLPGQQDRDPEFGTFNVPAWTLFAMFLL